MFASFSLSKMGFHNMFPDLPDICLNQSERILSTVPVASLISMGCVDARPNQSMAHVMACFQEMCIRDRPGADQLVTMIAQCMHKHKNLDTVLIVLESTSVYSVHISN